jgi:hypothetical protein
MDELPYEHADLTALVTTSNCDGVVSEGFGSVRVYAGEGRSFAIEVTEALSGLTVTAVLDFARPKRARSHLQADALRAAIESAAGEDGLPVPSPQPQ